MSTAPAVSSVPRGRPSKRFQHKVETHRRVCQDLLDRVAPVVIDASVSRANLKSIAEQAGISHWVLRRKFGGFEDLLRAVWDRQVKLVVSRLAYDPPVSRGVQASIYVYASFVAGVMQSEAYHGLLRLIVRYGDDYDWISSTYEKIICQAVRRGLEEAVYESGEESGCAVVLNEFASAEFHKRMETELATCRILPPYRPQLSVDVNAIVAKITSDTFKATRALGW
jgi:hypothetical protein